MADFPQSAFKVTLYRLVVNGATSGQDDHTTTLPYALDYDFEHEVDSRYDFFWRNLYNLDEPTYFKFYEDNVNRLIKSIQDAEFDLQYYDLTPYFIGYTLSMDLNTIAEAISLDIKESEFEVKTNDMIIIEEVALNDQANALPDSQIIFHGFVTDITNSLGYGEFLTQKLTVLNFGKIYSLARISVDASVSGFGITGKESVLVDIGVQTDIFTGLSVFEVIKKLYEAFFFAKIKDPTATDTIEYVLDLEKIKAFENFNVLFPFVYSLYLYNIKYNPDFKLCSITNGKHKAWNEQLRGAVQLFMPSYKTANDIISGSLTSAMYDYYFDYNGELIVRPPLYNYFPLDNFDPATQQFRTMGNFVITRDMIQNYDYIKNNMDIETVSTAYFTMPYIGVFDRVPPQFYEDLPALIKYGFKNEKPYNNPNAQSEKTARVLAMIYNVRGNSAQRTLNIKLKNDKSLAQFKYQLGRVYYIDLPDLQSIQTIGEQIQPLIDNNTKITNAGVMGYLTSIKRGYEYENFIVYDLTFTYIRDIEIIDLAKIGDNQSVLEDLYSIYGDNPLSSNPNPYGFMSKLQQNDNDATEVPIPEFDAKKKSALADFELVLREQNYYNNIPIFKTLPSVIDLIELTYSDTETQKKINENTKKLAETTTASDTPPVNQDMLVYKSFNFKMERFFNYTLKNNNSLISYNKPLYTVPIDVFPYFLAVEHDNKMDPASEDRISKVFQDKLKGQTVISNYQTQRYATPQFKLVKVDNAKTFGISDNNSQIYMFRTWMGTKGANGDDFTKISQKLFNRIIEMDADLTQTSGMPYYNNMFWKYGTSSDGNDMTVAVGASGTSWTGLTIGEPQILVYPYLYASHDRWALQDGSLSYIRQTYNIPSTLKKNLPRGYLLKKDRTSGFVGIIDGQDCVIPQDIVNYEDYNTNSSPLNHTLNGDYTFFSPAWFFNLQTIIFYNTILSLCEGDDSATLADKGITEGSELLKAHKEGRAIDFIMPARAPIGTAQPMPFVMFGLNGNYTVNDTKFAFFEDLLEVYFDKVVRTQNVMKVNQNLLRGITDPKVAPVMVDMAVYIYHIEVADKNYLNMDSEVLFSSAKRTGIIAL